MLPILNHDAIEVARLWRRPLIVNSSPLHWLRRGCEGAVVADRSACLPLFFSGLHLVADSLELGEALEHAMASRPTPAKISVMGEAADE